MSGRGLARRNRNGNGVCRSGDILTTMGSFDRMMDEVFSRFTNLHENFLSTSAPTLWGSVSKSSYPKVNGVLHANGDVELEYAVPGYSREDLNVSVEDGYVILEGQSCNKPEDANASAAEVSSDEAETWSEGSPQPFYFAREIHKSSFKRTLGRFEPDAYDFDSIEASLDSGILSIRIPRLTPIEPEIPAKKSVEIQ